MPKARPTRKRAREADPEASGSEGDAPAAPAPAKKTKSKGDKSAGGAQVDDDGNPFWELPGSGKRRVGLSEFKKIQFVSIREHYEANGVMKPGKKGISLTIEQYQALLQAAPAINAELLKKGHSVVGAAAAAAADGDAPVQPEEETEDKPNTKKSKAAKKTGKGKKANIEATSDEESGEESDS